ncbi:MAG: GTP cyclohydrolase FolE2 [Spirochaetaceae bacterium]|jgi:GTP cyclohydrolase I|nr:GTP cyclohydrolase FolE2 [Spirochaetaceae bacterium]GMO21898.1 MAG: GTP cyclohydrolase FolE2 [Termitinemataceae bacterium]
MIDVQKVDEGRGVRLERVGIKRLHYPIRLLVKGENDYQTPVATIELSVEVPANIRATHMSRFTRLVHRYKDAIQGQRFIEILKEMRNELESPSAFAVFSFPYYLEKTAPVSREASLMEYLCELHGTSAEGNDALYLSVTVPVTTLCPCSKAISEMGAHNQRADVTVKANVSKEFLWIEDIIKAVEDSASSPLYAVLKRVDEKYVTEQAYKNPLFVEDVVREVYLRIEKLYKNKAHCDFSIECESYESIHNHNAFAATHYQGAKK